jgi:hypothetical protein
MTHGTYPNEPLPGPKPRCDNCRHWDPPQSLSYYAFRKDFGTCQMATLRHGDTPTHPESKMFAEDTESYYAELTTAPDFFCALHEPKR